MVERGAVGRRLRPRPLRRLSRPRICQVLVLQ